MHYKIIGDSSCDVSAEMRETHNISIAPLSFTLDGVEYIDDDNLDLEAYLAKVDASPNTPKSACPSINDYMSLYEGDHECTYVVTLSSELSGSYNSAMNARELFLEDNPDKKVHVFDSRSAAASEVALALKIAELAEAGKEFHEIVEDVEAFRDASELLFVLDKIDTLEKNGRLSPMKAKIVKALNLKLILKKTDLGTIDLEDKARGTNRALKKLVEHMGKLRDINKETLVIITHVHAEDRAEKVKEMILDAYGPVKDVIILQTRGLSSTYANTGGIMVSF